MNPTFRVEAFIVPMMNREDSSEDNNIIDDVKVAKKMTIESPNKLKCGQQEEENTEVKQKSLETSDVNLKNDCLPIINIDFVQQKSKEIDEKVRAGIEEPIYDVPLSYLKVSGDKQGSVKLRDRLEIAEYVTIQLNPKHKVYDVHPPKSLIRTSSLMSIDERGETPEDFAEEFCCHGYKNGCTATTQRPEAVTQEVFEVNWMKRLEQLRARESIIKDKEAMLFERERLLFSKEKELRILERLVKDKLKHAELYLKRCRSQNKDLVDCEVESKFSEQSKESQSSRDGTESLESCHSLKRGNNVENELPARGVSKISGSLPSRSSLSDEKFMKNPPNSRSSLMSATDAQMHCQSAKSENGSSNFTARSTLPGFSGYSSLRSKRRPKVTYDDLDSTLSADIGDSSYVVTSRKFDPEVFKRPYAFTRTLSERRPSTIHEGISNVHFEEGKVMRKMSENILVSHDKNTKFQDYGLIDTGASKNFDRNNIDDRRHSYLNLEDGKKMKERKSRSNSKTTSNKDRPISWNEETNEWLQKKRQAYNLQAARKISTEDLNNKENHHESQLKVNQVQKKASKGKKFSIFR